MGCDGTVIIAPMGLRDMRYSPDGAAIHRPKPEISVVGRGVGRVELNCKLNFDPAALRRKPNATANGGGVMQLQLQLRSQGGRGTWRGCRYCSPDTDPDGTADETAMGLRHD